VRDSGENKDWLALAVGLGFGRPGADVEDNEYGIDTLQLMLRFMAVIEGKSKGRGAFNSLKSFLVQQLQRGIEAQEEENLLNGILAYLDSEPATEGRTEAMKYLFELKFLTVEPMKKMAERVLTK
jgi:hypothetical protein